jgi:hypothetical protein
MKVISFLFFLFFLSFKIDLYFYQLNFLCSFCLFFKDLLEVEVIELIEYLLNQILKIKKVNFATCQLQRLAHRPKKSGCV